MKPWIKKLQKLGACKNAIEWCKEGNYATLQDAWQACEREDRLLWLINKTAKIETTEARARYEATLEEVRATMSAAMSSTLPATEAAWLAALRQCADIVRKHYPFAPEI